MPKPHHMGVRSERAWRWLLNEGVPESSTKGTATPLVPGSVVTVCIVPCQSHSLTKPRARPDCASIHVCSPCLLARCRIHPGERAPRHVDSTPLQIRNGL